MASFAQKLQQKRPQNIFLITGGRDHTGMPTWFYVQIEPHLKMRFERAIKSGAMNVSEFGRIVESGYGEKPPELTRARMKRDYGFEG